MSQHAAVQESNNSNAPDLEHLKDQHRELDEKVNGLGAKGFRTEEEEAELHRLKKVKLRIKDQIEEVLHRN